MDDISLHLALHRLERAKEDLSDTELLYNNSKFKSANNRAYYAIFHAIRAVLALERKDFKRHKDVIAYFNQHYIKTEVFPKILGAKIGNAFKTRTDSDYEDEYVIKLEITYNQIETAKMIISLVENYLNDKSKSGGQQ